MNSWSWRGLGLLLVALITAFSAHPASSAADPVVAAAGDIACDPDDLSFNGGFGTPTRCRQRYTSELLLNAGLTEVLTTGDNVQSNSGGRLSEYRASYDPSWGRLKAMTRPSPGNHERGQGYFDYFNGEGVASGQAGRRGKGYYSFDVGAWHVVALNSNCGKLDKGGAADGCAGGSPQQRWLAADLRAHRATCTLAYWHHARFNSGHDGNALFMQPIWQTLYDAGVDVVLSSHAHHYERFAPQDPTGRLDPVTGIRQFIVGTGGSFFTGFTQIQPNSEVRHNRTFGILMLTLRATSYDWRFVPEAGGTFTDSGTGHCHLPPGAGTTLPRPPPKVLVPVTGKSSKGKSGVRCTIMGTDRSDLLKGSPRSDVICAYRGNDRVRGGDGNDVIIGGPGRDRLDGGSGRDRLYGNTGLDRLDGGSGTDRAVVDRRDRPRSVERIRRR